MNDNKTYLYIFENDTKVNPLCVNDTCWKKMLSVLIARIRFFMHKSLKN